MRLTDNPYSPPPISTLRRETRIRLHWMPVLIGFAIQIVGITVLGFLYGFTFFTLAFLNGSWVEVILNGYTGSIISWCVGTIPFLVGLIYVYRALDDSWIANGLLLATLSLVVSLPFLVFVENPFDWTFAVSNVIEFFIALVVGTVWGKLKDSKS